MWHIIKSIVRVFQSISSRILGNKKNYLNTPEEVLSWISVERIFKLCHIFPSFAIAIIVSVMLLPKVSLSYAQKLDVNATTIPLTFLICLVITLVLNGIIIEKLLLKYNANYHRYILEEKI